MYNKILPYIYHLRKLSKMECIFVNLNATNLQLYKNCTLSWIFSFRKLSEKISWRTPLMSSFSNDWFKNFLVESAYPMKKKKKSYRVFASDNSSVSKSCIGLCKPLWWICFAKIVNGFLLFPKKLHRRCLAGS